MPSIEIFATDWQNGGPSKYGIHWGGGKGGMDQKVLVTPVVCDRYVMADMLSAFRSAFNLGLYEASVELDYLKNSWEKGNM